MGDIRSLRFYRSEYSDSLLERLLPIFDDWLSAWSCISSNNQSLHHDISRAESSLAGSVLSLGDVPGMKLTVAFDRESLTKIYSLLLGDYDLAEQPIDDNDLVMGVLLSSVGELIQNITSELHLAVGNKAEYEDNIIVKSKRYHDVYNIKLGPVNIQLPAVLLPRSSNSPVGKRTSRMNALSVENASLDVRLTGIHLKVGDLVKLQPGQVLITDALLSQPFELKVAGKTFTKCYLGRKSTQKAIIIK